MGQAETLIKAPFRLPEHAVRAAFAVDANPVIDQSRFFADLLGGTVRLQGDEPLTPWDRATQAGMILALMQRHLNRDQQAILVGRYARAVTQDSSRVKEKCLWRSMNLIRPELPEIPLHFMVDTIHGWAGMPRQHKDMWWADFLDVDMRTIKRWRRGRSYKGRRFWGILSLLDTLEQECYGSLYTPMVDAGVVSPD